MASSGGRYRRPHSAAASRLQAPSGRLQLHTYLPLPVDQEGGGRLVGSASAASPPWFTAAPTTPTGASCLASSRTSLHKSKSEKRAHRRSRQDTNAGARFLKYILNKLMTCWIHLSVIFRYERTLALVSMLRT